jgi:ATP-binding cassette, subfamily G (WHITE), member 2, SNQ2
MANRSLIHAWDKYANWTLLHCSFSDQLYSSTRGLDASTALEFVRALRIGTEIGRRSTIVSIYQAGESLYELFDKVCVVYEGRMAYYGSAQDARQYFIDMGYEPANRQTTADFLLAVTDPKGRTARTDVKSIPRTAAEFEKHFQLSPLGQANKEDMESFRKEFVGDPDRSQAYKESAREEHASHVGDKSPYTISIPMQIRAVMIRRVRIMKGNWASQAIATMSVFLCGYSVSTSLFPSVYL